MVFDDHCWPIAASGDGLQEVSSLDGAEIKNISGNIHLKISSLSPTNS